MINNEKVLISSPSSYLPIIETHPFGNFVPRKCKYLFLGSFAAKPIANSKSKRKYDWFFANGRSQFWPILQVVYGRPLDTKESQQALFEELSLAITDVILSCERKANSSLDTNLAKMVFNTEAINKIVEQNQIKKIFFSSRFAEKLFLKNFKNILERRPQIELVTLPSPSPRYAAMRKEDKIRKYRELLPKLSGS